MAKSGLAVELTPAGKKEDEVMHDQTQWTRDNVGEKAQKSWHMNIFEDGKLRNGNLGSGEEEFPKLSLTAAYTPVEMAPRKDIHSKVDGQTLEDEQKTEEQPPNQEHTPSKFKMEHIVGDDQSRNRCTRQVDHSLIDCEHQARCLLDDSGSEGEPTCEDNHVRNDHDVSSHAIGIRDVSQYHQGDTEHTEVEQETSKIISEHQMDHPIDSGPNVSERM